MTDTKRGKLVLTISIDELAYADLHEMIQEYNDREVIEKTGYTHTPDSVIENLLKHQLVHYHIAKAQRRYE